MEKLIELLNEYRTEKGERNLNEFEVNQTLDSLNYLRLFIQRLVENDKIDRDKFEEIYEEWKNEAKYIAWADEDEMIIMLLSISDTPIDDLVSYLKNV